MRGGVLAAVFAGCAVQVAFTATSTAAPSDTDPSTTTTVATTSGSGTTTTTTTTPGATSTTTTVAMPSAASVPDQSTTTTSTATTLPPAPPSSAAPAVREDPTPTTSPASTSTTVPSLPGTNGPLPSGLGSRTATAPVGGRTDIPMRLPAEGDVDVIMATIRRIESGGRYDIPPNKAAASGAYQYIKSSWNNYGGYPEAYLAPSDVQDERARADIERILFAFHGDVSMIPVMWYYPHAVTDPMWMDRVPSPDLGNRLTVRDYQTRWLDIWAEQSRAAAAQPTTDVNAPAAVSVFTNLSTDPQTQTPALDAAPAQQPFQRNIVTVSPQTLDLAQRSQPPTWTPTENGSEVRSIVFPVLGPVYYADTWGAPRADGRTHEGTDILGVPMQPLLAAVDGTVETIRPEAEGISGVRITIQDADGWRYNYFHVNDDTPGTDDGIANNLWRIAPGLQLGAHVRAGQIIGYMGDSGNAEDSVPHLHFEIRDPLGVAHPSFASLMWAQGRQACSIGIGPWSVLPVDPAQLTTDSPTPAPIASLPTVVTTVIPLWGSGVWQIDSAGHVTATGDAALIEPSRDLNCRVGPRSAFGSDAGGWNSGVFDSSQVAGTILAGLDLRGSDLAPIRQVPSGAPPAPETPDVVPMTDVVDLATTDSFHDPSTGETIIVVTGQPSSDAAIVAPGGVPAAPVPTAPEPASTYASQALPIPIRLGPAIARPGAASR